LFISFFEFLAFLVVAACGVFILRRNFFHIYRLQHPDLKGWPMRDANNILTFEIVLMFLLFTMNATDALLQARGIEHYAHEGREPMKFFISRLFMPLYAGLSDNNLIFVERAAWWLHIIGILSFAVYVTYSKHLHIFLAFPNTYFANPEPKGKFENMESVTKEVKIMLGLEQDNGTQTADPVRFGAKDVQDLTWKNLMDAYSCTECGRCTEQCPANQTGKKLSPRKIMMATRDRMEDLGEGLDTLGDKFNDGKTLLDDYITREELNACTSCNACVEACPVNINPLDIIMQMRRYVAMEEAAVPDAWKSMLTNVQNNASPWPFSQEDRFKWANE
jgi:heterodisulfide reductase subunit C